MLVAMAVKRWHVGVWVVVVMEVGGLAEQDKGRGSEGGWEGVRGRESERRGRRQGVVIEVVAWVSALRASRPLSYCIFTTTTTNATTYSTPFNTEAAQI